MPPGLEVASFTVKASPSQLDFEGLSGFLESFSSFQRRIDGQGLRGALLGGDYLKDGHAHFEVTRSSATDDWTIEYEIVRGSHSSPGQDLLPASSFLGTIAKFLPSSEGEARGLFSASFVLSMKEWEPTVTLPFVPPGMLDHMPGAPRIAGVDFAFGDAGAAHGLLRAFVTTYDVIDEMVIRILMGYVTRWGDQVTPEMLKLAAAQLPIFARPKEDA